MDKSSKNFRRRIAAVGFSVAFGLGTLGGISHISNHSTHNAPPSNKNVSVENNSQYFSENEIYPTYCQLKNSLNSKNLNKNQIIEIGNTYKKLISSIDYIDYSNNEEDISIIDAFPKMDDLYTGIPEHITTLICENSVLLMPNGIDDFQKREISEHYLIYTDEIPFEDINILQTEKNKYCVVSNDKQFLFEISLSNDNEKTLLISMDKNIDNIEEISKQAISITNTNKNITTMNSNIIEDEKER